MIFIGGVREGDLRFCNQTCQQRGALLAAAQLVPDEEVTKRVAAIHQGPCPKCQRVGAIDVHTSHFVWSAVVLTSWKSTPQISCTACGKRAKIMAAAGSLFLGWWGFPWGFIFTPIQIGRNIWGLARSPSSFAPSAHLEQITRLMLADEVMHARRAGAIPPPLPKVS